MSVVEKITFIEHKDLTMIIDAPPRFVGAFFQPVRSRLTKPQFHHLWALVLDDYQVLSKDAIQRHLHMCGLAHSACGGLTHHSMEAVSAQARKANVEVPLPTMNERLTVLRDTLRRDQVRQLLRGKRRRKLRQKIKEYLLAA